MNIFIVKIFTEEDKKFNRMMIDEAKNMQKINHIKSDNFKNRNYDFVSDIIKYFRKKYGINDEN